MKKIEEHYEDCVECPHYSSRRRYTLGNHRDWCSLGKFFLDDAEWPHYRTEGVPLNCPFERKTK